MAENPYVLFVWFIDSRTLEGLDRDANNEGLCIIVLAADNPIMVKCGAWTGKDGLTVKGESPTLISPFSVVACKITRQSTQSKKKKWPEINGLCWIVFTAKLNEYTKD